MIFLVTEWVSNGKATVSVCVSGIEAESFQEAKLKLIISLDTIPMYEVIGNNDTRFRYITSNNVVGQMESEPLKML